MERNREHERWVIAERLSKQFIQRQDIHARQLEDGRYLCVRQPFKTALMYLHLRGDITLGTYMLDINSQARFMVLDADDETSFQRLTAMALDLQNRRICSYQEASRRGGHIWFFFQEPITGEKAKGFGEGLLKIYGLDAEVYPKQSRLSKGPGSLMRVPFGIHRKSGQRYGFVGIGDFRQQQDMLSSPQTVPSDVVEMYQCWKETRHHQSKEARFVNIPLVDVIGQYIDLHPIASGYIGLCPFHEDNVPSFGVNVNGNYWHCFAGCGGGDIVSFWMKLNNCDFKTAVEELEKILDKSAVSKNMTTPLHDIPVGRNQTLSRRK